MSESINSQYPVTERSVTFHLQGWNKHYQTKPAELNIDEAKGLCSVSTYTYVNRTFGQGSQAGRPVKMRARGVVQFIGSTRLDRVLSVRAPLPEGSRSRDL